jgi:CNT family concentrative nucleoside transporter
LEVSQTKGDVVMTVPKQFSNLMDAITSGCSDGLKIGLNVTAMLIGFIALLGLLDYTSAAFFSYFFKINDLTLTAIIGKAFSGVAYLLGVSWKDTGVAGELMGIKLFANEFVAYSKLRSMLGGSLDPRSITIITFALCGFANFSSVGIQIGGISGIEPSRRDDLLKLSLRALLAGTLTSYLSAAIAGLLS